jgi:hypothetical protein
VLAFFVDSVVSLVGTCSAEEFFPAFFVFELFPAIASAGASAGATAGASAGASAGATVAEGSPVALFTALGSDKLPPV